MRYRAKFPLQRSAAVDCGFLSPALITDGTILTSYTKAERARTEPSPSAIVDSSNRPPLNHRRAYKAVNLFQRLHCSKPRHIHSYSRTPSAAKCLSLIHL